MSIPTNPVSVGNATKKSDYDALYNGTVLADTGGTAGGAQSIPGVKTFEALAEVNLTSGRTAYKEIMTVKISVAGWYTIAEVGALVNTPSVADVAICDVVGGILGCTAAVCNSKHTKTHINTTIILNKHASSATTPFNQIEAYRIAKSDSVSAAGFKLQAYLNPRSARNYNIQISNNHGNSANSRKGWELVTPYLDSTPTLPDGTTVGTFLIAGAELSLSASSQFLPMWGYVIDDNSIRVTFLWNGIPYQGTTLTITDPSTSWTYYLGSGATAGITSLTVSSLLINQQEKLVSATLTKTGQWAGKANLPIIIRAVGTGGKLTLS